MGRPATAVCEILALLEPYLEALLVQYEAQPTPRKPSLPATPDRKVNVRAVVRDAGLKPSQEQHFYRSIELARVLNAAAEAQELGGIGSRAEQNADDDVALKAIARARSDVAELSRALAEREGLVQRQRERIRQLEQQLRIMESTGMILRTEPTR